MDKKTLWSQEGFKKAFFANEQQERIKTGKAACALVVFLMPLGTTLDFFVYPSQLSYFLQLRLFCSFLVGIIWFLHNRSFGQRFYRFLGLPIAILPAFFIAWMVFVTEGAKSPYYAGLILILLAVTAVVHWTTWESLLSVSLVLLMYLGACYPWNIQSDSGIFFNNTYFLLLTGIIVVTGNYLFNELHFREFALRFELDQNRQKLEESNRKLIELDQVKNRFFANVSHELRTPLTLLLAPLESLQQRGKATFDGETRELLATMRANSMRLLKLINDLLDLVRMESGRMEVKREPLVVKEFIRGLVNEVQKTAEDKKIRLETTVDNRVGKVLADTDKLEKILLNLTFNALKFTPAGGKIQVTVERQNGELLFQVADTGVGISRQKLPFIFDRFWQGDTSSQRQYQGVGIGLALVKELVEVQGGKVEVESQVGKGTQFTVRFPYVQAESNATATPGKSLEEPMSPRAGIEAYKNNSEEWLKNLYRRAELFPSMNRRQGDPRIEEVVHNNGRPRVLIADDEPDMLRFLRSQLQGQFQVLEAVDGQQAIEKASQFLPDIILCDMMMPVKDGVEVCRELRGRTPTQSIPVVLLTAWADDETKLKALSAGVSDFLTKPFSTMELNVRLKNLVDAYYLQRKLARQNQMLEATLEQLKETESQLVHSEKLASLGRMSAGIIHEINNPLNFAKTGLYTLQNLSKAVAGEKETDFKEILKDVEDGIVRVQNIVSELHTFTQPNPGQLEDVAVVKLVGTALRLLGNQWRDKLRIVQEIAEEQTVSANRNQVTQVIVNLLQNAFYAVTNKYFLEDKPTIWIESCCENGESRIVIRDNGEGIAPENLNKIFDPFFTTKDVGQGMGLGLSVCYRIMEQHGGQIRVKSEKGQYSEFVLAFPSQK